MAGGSTFVDRVAEVVELFRADPISGWVAAGRLAEDFPGSVRWPECARLLQSRDPADRVAGVALLQGGEGELPAWVEQLRVGALDDPDPDVVAQALWQASLRRSPAALPALARVATHSTPMNRLRATESLAMSPGLGCPALVTLVRDPEVMIRRCAVRAVALGVQVSTDDVGSALMEASRDPDEQVRSSALAGLAVRGLPGTAGLIAAQLDKGQVGPELLQAAELAADPALMPALARFAEREPDLVAGHRGAWRATMSACAGTAWTLHPRSSRGGSDEPLAQEERLALESRQSRSGGGGSTCVWLRDCDVQAVWLVDLATLRWQRFPVRDVPPSPTESPAPVAGWASRARWGGMVGVYRIGSHHRMIVGRQRFDLTRPRTVTHRCRGLLSMLSAAQGAKSARAGRLEGSYWPESIGFGDPMITDHEPLGSWYPLHHIATLANAPSDHTAGPYDYRHDHQALITP